MSITKQEDVLQVMSAQGHDEIKFDPSDPEDVNRVKQEIKQKMKKGYKLAMGKKGSKELEFVKDVDEIDNPEFDRLFLMPDTRKLLTAPNAGG